MLKLMPSPTNNNYECNARPSIRCQLPAPQTRCGGLTSAHACWTRFARDGRSCNFPRLPFRGEHIAAPRPPPTTSQRRLAPEKTPTRNRALPVAPSGPLARGNLRFTRGFYHCLTACAFRSNIYMVWGSNPMGLSPKPYKLSSRIHTPSIHAGARRNTHLPHAIDASWTGRSPQRHSHLHIVELLRQHHLHDPLLELSCGAV